MCGVILVMWCSATVIAKRKLSRTSRTEYSQEWGLILATFFYLLHLRWFNWWLDSENPNRLDPGFLDINCTKKCFGGQFQICLQRLPSFSSKWHQRCGKNVLSDRSNILFIFSHGSSGKPGPAHKSKQFWRVYPQCMAVTSSASWERLHLLTVNLWNDVWTILNQIDRCKVTLQEVPSAVIILTIVM